MPAGRGLPVDAARDLLDAHPVATLLLDRDGIIRWVNPAMEGICNTATNGLIGKPIGDVVHPRSEALARQFGDPEQGCTAYATPVTLGPARDVMLVDIHLEPMADGDRLLTIQPPPRVADRLGDPSVGGAGRSAAAAAAMLAHEVKNPLSGIRGAAQLLARGGDASRARFTDLIVQEVDRIAGLIDRMQAFSRDTPVAVAAISPYPAITQARDVILAGADTMPDGRAGVQIVEAFDPSLPHVWANHDALVQILINLMKNAIEARGDAPAEIVLSTAYRHGIALRPAPGSAAVPVPIEIGVSDRGPGVPDHLVADMFSPFVTGRREGQGLGLALVDRLVRDMGGMVQYRRDDRSGWTHFRLFLSIAPHGQEEWTP